MSLYQDPLNSILASIKSTSKIDLIADEYVYGTPTPIEVDSTGTNTSISITAKSVASTYDGAVTVKYKRLNLADIPRLLGGSTIQVPSPKTTVELAQAINRLYGTLIKDSDVVKTDITNLVNGTGDVVLTAAQGSLGWIGEVTFSLLPGRYQLGDILTTTTLDGLDYAEPYVGKPFASSYSYHLDFSSQHAVLVDLDETNLDLTAVKNALVAVTGNPWVTSSQARYSLDGATGVYNGFTASFLNANESYDRVLVVQLSDACLGFSGRLFMHYNPQVD